MSAEEPQGIEENLYFESPKSFNFEMPLYEEMDLGDKKVAKKIYELVSFSDTVDAYCIWCDKESVFKATEVIYETPVGGVDTSALAAWLRMGNLFDRVSYRCTRNSNHNYFTYYLKSGKLFEKIGQFPSTAALQIPQVQKYKKILGELRYGELVRGIGLAAHGIGIGSFVYIRRVFEVLVEQAHTEALKDKDFPEDEYLSGKMNEKIPLLKDYLPSFLVENKNLYGIISKGVHELTEQECLKYYPAVKAGIELILDEKIKMEEEKSKISEVRKAIGSIVQEIVSGPLVEKKEL